MSLVTTNLFVLVVTSLSFILSLLYSRLILL